MTHQDIANKSGLAKSTVVKISKLKSWNRIPLETIEKFSSACGVNLLSPSDKLYFFFRKRTVYLTRATKAQKKLFARLMRAMKDGGSKLDITPTRNAGNDVSPGR